ncbi:hypothetical protein QYE76_034339 [Lolium multiflorum]|uniref:Uncharacterized protein n=1 Tax=Lolium multiflorum TaxID=4521 RepID=A0AAD8QXJ9_LOLMU|nr:hypothetical protein QYE76_034339 [Lolium multiflorum]
MHLLRHGFMPSYNCWTKHGERGVRMEEDEEGDDIIDDNYPDHFGDTFMEDVEGGEGEGEGEGEGKEEARDEPADDLGRTIAGARRRCDTEKERENLDRMLEDHKNSLYPGCDNGLKKLGCTLDLLKWKAREGVADSGFENFLKMLKNMFPKNNELPTSTYEAKKVVCSLGLEVLKIHACINDCILYRGEYENLNECPEQRACQVVAMAQRGHEKWKVDIKAKREPEPKSVFSEKEEKWAKSFFTTPSQVKKNMPDDYGRELRRQAEILAEKKALAKKEKKALEEKKEETAAEHGMTVTGAKEKAAEFNMNLRAVLGLEDAPMSELFNLRELDKSILSCYVLMKIGEFQKRNIHDVGFIDPHIVNGYVLERFPRDVEKDLKYSRIDETNARGLIFPRSFQKTEGDTKWGHEVATPQGGAAKEGPAPPYGVGLSSASRLCPFAYKFPPSRKPYYREPRYGKSSRNAAANPISGIQEIASGTLPERGIITGGLYITMIASGLMRE